MVLHVGSGRWEKNHKLILNVAKRCQDKGDNVRFCLVGPDVEKNYGDEAGKLALNNVCFLGVRRDVDNLLQVADLFIFPSLSEGQPNALLEALMVGLPFIASDIEPIRELLPEGWKNSWLFSPEDSEKAYFLLLSHLNNDFRQNKEFKNLVQWSQARYNEDTCFGNFFITLAH
jgi:glycosyltransferase involved in cell wall biosynthesis